MHKLACEKSTTALGNTLFSEAGVLGAAEHHSPDAYTRNTFQPKLAVTAVKCGTSLLHCLLVATLPIYEVVRERSGFAQGPSEIRGGPSWSLQGHMICACPSARRAMLGEYVLQKKKPSKMICTLQHIKDMKYL